MWYFQKIVFVLKIYLDIFTKVLKIYYYYMYKSSHFIISSNIISKKNI